MYCPPSLKPSEIAVSIAPEIAWPELCATILVVLTWSARSLALSAGMETDWVRADEVDALKAGLPL